MIIHAYAASLTVTLQEQNPDNFRAAIRGDATGGETLVQDLNTGGTTIFANLNPGSYTINMIGDDNIIWTVDIQNRGEGCDNRIGSNDDQEICLVELGNTIDGSFGGVIGGPTGALGAGFGTPETLAETSTGQQLVQEDERNDPPFRGCEAYEITQEGESKPWVRAPSGAQYFIKGAISGERLQSLINENGRNDATLSIVNDLHQIDPLSISNEINSKYIGQLVFYKEDGAKKDVLNFRIDNIDTECRYITLIQPSQKLSASQKYQWTPLSEEGKEKFEKHGIPGTNFEQPGLPGYNKNPLMAGEASLKFPTRIDNLQANLAMNPPFTPCVPHVTELGWDDTDDDGIPDDEIDVKLRNDAHFAEYIIVGDLEDKISSANKNSDEDLLIKITTDLNLVADDNGRITNNENPYAKIELFLNPDEHSAQHIDFRLKELSTNCHGVGFAR